MNRQTPSRRAPYVGSADMFTPPAQTSLCRELKQALYDRNLLTAKSRRKIGNMLVGGSSDTINQTAGGGGEADKRQQFRHQAIREILTSERSYIAQLDVLMQFFVVPLKTRTDLMSPEQYQAVFGQVNMIHSLNAELLHELEADLDNVARAFKRIAPFLKLYSVYAFDYNRAQLILQELTEKNAAFKRFLEANESRPEVQRKLISLLIAPIQRVPRYRMLLQQVVLYSSPADAEFRGLQESVREVEATVNHLNAVIQDQENMQALLDLQNSLTGRQPAIVQPSRKVIREGALMKMSSSGQKLRRHCVLMSDIFMYCKYLKERPDKQLVVGSLQCCCIFPLKKCRVSEIFPGTFKLTCQGDGIILCADDAAGGRAWLSSIADTIEVHVQCRKTIRKGSSKRAPIRRKDVRKFEAGVGDEEGHGAMAKRKNEFDSVLKCSSDSDSELNGTSTATCFGRINPAHLFGGRKRSRSEAHYTQPQLPSESVLPTPTKPTTPKHTSFAHKTMSPVATPPIRHWFQPGVGSISALAQNSQMMLTSTPEQRTAGKSTLNDSDPTYGMAAYAHHRSIATDFNADNDESRATTTDDAVGDCKRQRLFVADDGAGGGDVMSPLRHRNVDGSLATIRKKNRMPVVGDFEQNVENCQPTTTKRKRVQFDMDANRVDYTNQPYPFAEAIRPVQAPTSLRSRIAGFFASLF